MHTINGWNIPQQGDKFNTNWAQMYDDFMSKYATIVNSATNEVKFYLPPSDSTAFTLSGNNGNIMVIDTTNSATPTLKYYGAISATGGVWDGAYRVYSDGNKPNLSVLPGNISVSQISATGSLTSATYLRGDGQWATVTSIGATGALSASPTSVITVTNGGGSVLGNGVGLTISQATSATNGYVSSADWNTFNSKANIIHYHSGEQITSGVISNDRLSAQGIYTSIGDPYFNNVALLTHLDGVDGSTNLIDVKGNPLSAWGNAQISTSAYKFGGSSLYLNGSNTSYIYTNNIPSLNVGTGAFTLEFWFMKLPGCSPLAGLITNGYSSWGAGSIGIRFDGLNKIVVYAYGSISGELYPMQISTQLVDNQWYHFALTRQDNTFRAFIDGVLKTVATDTIGLNFNLNNKTNIGYSQADGTVLKGYIDELRFTVGVSRYNSSFSVQTEAFYNSLGGGTTPSTGSVQWNSIGKFGGDSDFVWDDVNKIIYTTSGVNTLGQYMVSGIPHNHDGRYASSAHNQAWSTISATPTTLSGYGITDSVSISTSGVFALSAHQHNQSDIISSAGWITSATTLTENVISTVSAGAIIPGQTLTSGMSFTTFVKNLLLKTFYPTFVTPTASLASSLASNIESGTTGNVTLTVTYNRGQINGKTVGGIWEPATLQDYRAGVASKYVINSVDMGTSASSVVNGYQVVDGSNTWNSTVTYTQGPQPVDSLGANYNTPLTSGTLSPSVTVTGKRKAFYGTDSVSDVPYTTTSQIRAIANSVLGPVTSTAFTINIPIGAKMVVFAYPATLRDVSSVVYIEGMSSQIKSIFTLTTINVEGASGYSATSYKVYTYVPASPYTATATYNVII